MSALSEVQKQIVHIYGDSLVRCVFDENQKPWFVAKDICSCLGLANVSRSIKGDQRTGNVGLDADEYQEMLIEQSDRIAQEITCVNESGMFTLMFKSSHEDAKKFRKWVTSVVLPQIRETGSYCKKTDPLDLLPEDMRSRVLMARELREMGYDPQLSADLILGRGRIASRHSHSSPINREQAEHLLCGLLKSIFSITFNNPKSTIIATVWMRVGEDESTFYPPSTPGTEEVLILRLTALSEYLPAVNAREYARVFSKHEWFLKNPKAPRIWRFLSSVCWLFRKSSMPTSAMEIITENQKP